ncbi:MAG: hypothetical protein RPU60_02630 [Candidatus Sedimenticola sp. (ex Thyasira tokunagai)]
MSMNIPSIPTDSLNKFCAISGLLLALFSAFGPPYFDYQLGKEISKIEYQTEVLKSELSVYKKSLQRKFLIPLNDVYLQLYKDSPEKALEHIEKYISLSDSLLKNRLITETKTAEIDYQIRNIESTNALLEKVNNISYIFFALGLLLLTFGFVGWYISENKTHPVSASKATEEKLKED